VADTKTISVNESDVARLKVDVLRRRLKDRGVKGTADLKKAELVKKLVKEYKAEAKASTPKRTVTAKAGSATAPVSKESEISRLKVTELRSRLKEHGVKGTSELKKPELVKKLVKAYKSDAKPAKKK
jgi:hypothetical protein